MTTPSDWLTSLPQEIVTHPWFVPGLVFVAAGSLFWIVARWLTAAPNAIDARLRAWNPDTDDAKHEGWLPTLAPALAAQIPETER